MDHQESSKDVGSKKERAKAFRREKTGHVLGDKWVHYGWKVGERDQKKKKNNRKEKEKTNKQKTVWRKWLLIYFWMS